MFVFRGKVLSCLPHPSLDQFTDEYFYKTFFSPDSTEGNGSLNKWFYFYCNPVLDPLVITIRNNKPYIHPGLKRFIGTALREVTYLPVWIISDSFENNFEGILQEDFVQEIESENKWIEQIKNNNFSNDIIHCYIGKHLRKYRWDVELPDGRIFSLNPHDGEIIKNKWEIKNRGLITSLTEMFKECYEFIEPPIDGENADVYIGFDSKQESAYNVCKYSIEKLNKNIAVSPIRLDELRTNNLYWRNEDSLSSTEFTFSRFLVPYLSKFKGWSVFCDSDFLFLEDIENLFKYTDDKYAVMVVKHNYIPSDEIKMDGSTQFKYPRKNWSSLILWNNKHPSNKILTPELINSATGQFLHQFIWLTDNEIGSLPHEWNWLVNWYKEPQDGKPRALHYTEGGPWFENYKNCEYSELWLTEYHNLVLSPVRLEA